MRRTRPDRRFESLAPIRAFVGVLGVAVLVGGCPFDTRPPVRPIDIPVACLSTDAIQDQEAIQKVQTAFGCGPDGIELFRNQHAPDFVFQSLVLSEAESAQLSGSGIVDRFGGQIQAAAEASYAAQLAAPLGDEETAGDATIFRNVAYTLTFASETVPAVSFGGIANITVRPEGARFVISRWEDGEGAEGLRTIGEFYLSGTSESTLR